MDQRSPEWFEARLGKVTASRIADIVQGLALVVVLPAALIASGAFDLIRQVAS